MQYILFSIFMMFILNKIMGRDTMIEFYKYSTRVIVKILKITFPLLLKFSEKLILVIAWISGKIYRGLNLKKWFTFNYQPFIIINVVEIEPTTRYNSNEGGRNDVTII